MIPFNSFLWYYKNTYFCIAFQIRKCFFGNRIQIIMFSLSLISALSSCRFIHIKKRDSFMSSPDVQ